MDFDYTFKIPQRGILSPNEVHFFYYDVMREMDDSFWVIYEWDNEIEKFLNEKGIKVETKEKGAISQNVDKNVVFFSTYQNESKPIAFFRHLRNAFAHHRITYWGEFLHIEDIQGNDRTMKGLIKYQDLKELCFLFFNQRTSFESDNNL